MAKTDALVEKVRNIYSSAKTTHRSQWEHIAKILNDRNESIKKMNKRR